MSLLGNVIDFISVLHQLRHYYCTVSKFCGVRQQKLIRFYYLFTTSGLPILPAL